MISIDGKTLDLMREILSLISSSIYSNDLEKIANRYAGGSEENKIKFLNSLYTFLCSLPQGVWTNNKARKNGLDTILNYLEKKSMTLYKDECSGF